MRITFYKSEGGRLCRWVAQTRKGREFQGSTMAAGRDLPHDILQLVVETALRSPHGFWNLVAHGAWFKSIPGRKRTREGLAVVARYRAESMKAEHEAGAHATAWRTGARSPVAARLAAAYADWRALPEGVGLDFEWREIPLRAPERG